MKFRSYLLALAACALLVDYAGATAFQIQSDIADYEAHRTQPSGPNAVSNGTVGDNRIGRSNNDHLVGIGPALALPTIPSGEEIVAATLNVTFKGENATLRPETGDGNIDVYGLPYDAAPLVQDADRWYGGPNDGAAGVTKLQDDWVTVASNPADTVNTLFTSVDIGSWLKSLYTGGAVAGDFAILRLSYDANALDGNNRYRIVTSGGDAGTIDASPHTIAQGAPYLSITTAPTVPEPASLALLCLAGAGLVGIRRRWA